jgi:hypothetical protein
MARRYFVLLLLLAPITSCRSAPRPSQTTQAQSASDHLAWVTGALTRMQAVKPGMTRHDLLAIFTTEGGLSTRLQRTFVSRDCPYFKVDVEFEAVGRAARAQDGRITAIDDDRDIIMKISKPYLAFAVAD